MQQAETLQTRLASIIEQAQGTWGVVVEELGAGIRYEHLPDESFIAESVIKVPIMAAVFAAAHKGAFSLDDRLALRREDLVKGSGLLYALSPGMQLSIRDLVTLMIIQSDNTATNILIDLVGKEGVDQTMIELGMERSRYVRKLMIYPVDIQGNNMITARDVSGMLGRLAAGQFLGRQACEEMIAIMKKQQFLNGLPSLLPVLDVDGKEERPTYWEIASKGGWDTGRQHDAGLLHTKGRCFVMTALSQDVEADKALYTLGCIGRAVYEYAQGK
jgi:beta-lactamase class A